MKVRLLIIVMLSVLLFQSNCTAFAKRKDLSNKNFYKYNIEGVEEYNPYQDIDEKYSYNEPENTNTTPKYLKTKYDFNMGEDSQMSVGLKGFSFKFKY